MPETRICGVAAALYCFLVLQWVCALRKLRLSRFLDVRQGSIRPWKAIFLELGLVPEPLLDLLLEVFQESGRVAIVLPPLGRPGKVKHRPVTAEVHLLPVEFRKGLVRFGEYFHNAHDSLGALGLALASSQCFHDNCVQTARSFGTYERRAGHRFDVLPLRQGSLGGFRLQFSYMFEVELYGRHLIKENGEVRQGYLGFKMNERFFLD